MASAYEYNTWVEKLTNSSAKPGDIDKICLKKLYVASDKPNTPFAVVVSGESHAVAFKCNTKGTSQDVCDGVLGSPGYQPTGKGFR